MKTFEVSMPFTGFAVRIIEAETEEEAISKFNDDTIMPFDLKSGNVDDMEWDFTDKIVGGNVFYGVQNEVNVTVVDGEEDE